MRRCIELAVRAQGQTRPNPVVGCVIVSEDGNIVGEGFHPRAGQPHAEIFALLEAGGRARGSTVYVSLEPCNHYGRTPPCAEALIKASPRRVVVGMIDPDSRTRAHGIARLRQAGIDVHVNVLEKACRRINEGFCFVKEHERPFGLFKYAMTLDGKTATDSGSSRWISSATSREWVHRLRSRCDAIVVGGNTIRIDDPSLTVRLNEELAGDLRPMRVVLTRSLSVDVNARVFDSTTGETYVVTRTTVDPASREKIQRLQDKGVHVVELEDPSPYAAMQFLGDRGALNVLWECGGRLAADAVRQGCIQRVHAFIAPKLIGGGPADPHTPMAALGLIDMESALVLENVEVEQFGPDVLVSGTLPPPSQHLHDLSPNRRIERG